MKRFDLAAECSKCGSITKDLTESPIGDLVNYEDHIAAIDQLREIIDGQAKVIKRYHQMDSALKVIAIWALHPDEDTLSQIHHRAMEALGE